MENDEAIVEEKPVCSCKQQSEHDIVVEQASRFNVTSKLRNNVRHDV